MSKWEWIGHPDEGVRCYVLLTSLKVVEAEWHDGRWQSDDQEISDRDIVEWREV